MTSHGRQANVTSSALKRSSLIIQLARIIRFVVALNKHIKNVMEIIATDSNKVSIEWKLISKNKFTITFYYTEPRELAKTVVEEGIVNTR